MCFLNKTSKKINKIIILHYENLLINDLKFQSIRKINNNINI